MHNIWYINYKRYIKCIFLKGMKVNLEQFCKQTLLLRY
jgi:hypothetical protein